MKVKFFGHAATLLEKDGKKILIDPFISGNPLTDVEPKDLEVDTILVTHGHGDHLGDTIEIAKNCDALVIGIHELSLYCQSQGVAKVHGMSIGGGYDFDFGRVKMVMALHSGGMVSEDGDITYLGSPCGYVIEMGDITVYHAGDTGLFGDMSLIGEEFDIDLAFLPIGDNYVMGPKDALKATSFLNPKGVIPIHYNTFPVIEQDPEDFKNKLEELEGIQCIILEPGQNMDIT